MSINAGKKSGRGRPRRDTEEVAVRMERLTLDHLDAWIAQQPEPIPGRPEAIRRIIKSVLNPERK